MGVFNRLFNKVNEPEKNVYYRANIFQKNIASEIELDSLDSVISIHHSIVSITKNLLSIKTNRGEEYSFPIKFYEKDSFTTTHIGIFKNGYKFRLIQPKDLSLEMAKSTHNALGAFTLGTVNPNGWAVHFILTDIDDIRQNHIYETGSAEQIQKLIQGAMLGIQFGLPNKFIEFSKRLLPMIENNPFQLNNFDGSEDFIQIMKNNIEAYNNTERIIINKI
jgi:hypothetical protein